MATNKQGLHYNYAVSYTHLDVYKRQERVSMVLNADDHIRLQVLASGLDLQECYAKADALDDYINEKIPYAFNEKYGYLTSYPTNVGTAMKASVVVHLPSLTMNKKFQELLGDMGRLDVYKRQGGTWLRAAAFRPGNRPRQARMTGEPEPGRALTEAPGYRRLRILSPIIWIRGIS